MNSVGIHDQWFCAHVLTLRRDFVNGKYLRYS